MSDKNKTDKTSPDYNKGYEEGYKSKDYTWGDGINDALFKWAPESDERKEGYAEGERDRVRDDTQKDKK